MRKLWAFPSSHPVITVLGLFAIAILGVWLIPEAWAELRWQLYLREGRARGVQFFLEGAVLQTSYEVDLSEAFQTPVGLPDDSLRALRNKDWATMQQILLKEGWLEKPSTEPVRDFLRALERFDPQVSAWDAALLRPYSLLSDKSKPHPMHLHEATRLFVQRGVALLELGDSATAYLEFVRLARTYEHLRADYYRGNLLRDLYSPRESLLFLADHGMARRAWGDAELQQMQAEASRIQCKEPFETRGEAMRRFLNEFYEEGLRLPANQRGKSAAARDYRGLTPPDFISEHLPSPVLDSFCDYVPRRFLRENQLRDNRLLDQLNSARTRQELSRLTKPFVEQAMEQRHPDALAFIGGIIENFHTDETSSLEFDRSMEVLKTTCALERFQRAKGQYPEQLSELIPAWLDAIPVSPISGEPLIYRREAGGQCTLESGAIHVTQLPYQP